jgi:pimeloyl-ACP methyl ester carboxylesterase
MRILSTFALVLLAVVLPATAADTLDVYEAVEHHVVDSDGVDIHYVTLGEGPVVLFVHGFPDFWYTWRNQMAALSGDFKTVAMDTRANNKSGKPEGVENYEMDLLLADVEAVIDDLGADDVTLVGHDWGGAIAWRFAMFYPQRVNKLVICNLTHPTGYMTVRRNATPEQQANTQYIAEFQKPDAASRFTPEMLAQMVAGRESDEVKQRYLDAYRQSYIDGMLNYYRAAWSRLNSGEEEIPTLQMPVLQFHGLEDTAVDKDGLRDTWNWIAADYTLVTTPDHGHWIQGEAADLVSTTMEWWLKARP